MLCSRVVSNIDTPTMTFKPGLNMFFVGFFFIIYFFKEYFELYLERKALVTSWRKTCYKKKLSSVQTEKSSMSKKFVANK